MIISHSMQMFAMKFLAFKVEHWCARPSLMQNSLDLAIWRNISSPLVQESWDKCRIFEVVDFSNHTRPLENMTTVECSRFEVFFHLATRYFDFKNNYRVSFFNESILSNVLKSSIFITFAQNMVYLTKNTLPFVILKKNCHFCYENI